MSLQGTYEVIISALGITIQSNVTRLASQGIEPVDVDLPAGKAGTLTTRTNNTDGAATLSAGHGILTADVVDIYWDGGCRYGAIVGTVAGNVVPFGSGSGDNLPLATTALVVTKQVSLDVTFDGDNLVLIGASASQRSHLTFVDAGGAILHPVAIDPGEAWAWVSDTGVDNPLSGNAVASIKASNGSSTNSSNLKLTGLQYAA
jgi:hypothetical protein